MGGRWAKYLGVHMKCVLFFLMIISPCLLFGQFYPDTFKVSDSIDILKFETVLKKPFNNALIAFMTKINNPFFFFEIMGKNDINLDSNLFIRGPVASSIWTIKTTNFQIEIFIDRISNDTTIISNYYINTIAYSNNFNLDPIIKIGMTTEEVVNILGQWNYKKDSTIIYHSSIYSIQCQIESNKVLSVKMFRFIDN